MQFPMSLERSTRIQELVDSSFDLSLTQLRSFLERECANDPELRAEVERRILERDTVEVPPHVPARACNSLAPGEVVAGRYRITRLTGSGGMGEVYEAFDLLLNEDVALKTLRGDLAHHPSLVHRFQDEILLARKVTHPNVCRIFEVGVHESLLFFAMELLKGETLAARIRRGRLTRAEAFPIAVQLAEGLQAAHRAGIVHADFKSGNVILVPEPHAVRAVITDFGVARLDAARIPADAAGTVDDRVHVAGTIAYMSPEQLAGERITAASDIYSFGVVLFEMASGELPFDNRDLIKSAMLRASSQGVSIRSKVSNIDPRWEAAIARCLQKEPGRRFASAGELAAWFGQGAWRNIRNWTRRDLIRASVAVCLLLVAGVGGWMLSHRPYQPAPAALRSYQTGVNALYSMTYETARKALEQAVAADPSFALAHASLARAYDELDYTDRAKDSMLRAVSAAQDTRLTPNDERKLRAMQFMISRDYERAAPLLRQIEDTADVRDGPGVALESGWLAQQMEDSEAANAAYMRALQRAPSYAAAKLRLGYMLGRRGKQDDLALALRAFDEAEQLYGTTGDYEGVTQTLLERANLLDRRSRETEALPFVEKALGVARLVGNRYQEIRLLLLQGTARRDLGETTRAIALVQQAIDMALAENMDNLATTGLIDLGNIHLLNQDLKTAEPLFRRALETARRGKVRRIEARAQVSLGSLCEQDHRPEEAKRFMEAGLSFYTQAGYRRESIQAAIVLAGVIRQLGKYEDGIRILRETLPNAQRLQDRRLEAQLHERIADSLRDRADWPEALSEYELARNLYGPNVQGEYMRVSSAGLRWRLGQRQQAESSLSEAERFEAQSHSRRLLASIRVQQAAMAYADGRLTDVLDIVRKALPAAGGDDDLVSQLTLTRALVLVKMGRHSQGLTDATGVVNRLEQARLAGEAAVARLSIAEALAIAGHQSPALQMAGQALTFFEPRRIWEAVLRGHLIAIRGSPEPSDVDAHRDSARAAMAQLRNAWNPATVDRYLETTNINVLSGGLRY